MNTTVQTLLKKKQAEQKFAVIAAYDASFATAICDAGVDVILIGDSLGMVLQGEDSTVPVTIDHIAYHTRCVKNGNKGALLVADMPFNSYTNTKDATAAATQLMQAGAHMVKLEGGEWLCDTVNVLSRSGTPVCAHLGLTPQSVHTLGGYKVQGREADQAKKMIQEAQALEQAGAQLLVLECVPQALAKQITATLNIPTIGIGAGPDTDAQVLVLHDMLGLNETPAKFVRNFMDGANSIQTALKNYNDTVKSGEFPAPEHCFN